MRSAEQWKAIERSLDPDWEVVRLTFASEDEGSARAAARALAPLGPGRSGRELRIQVARSGGGRERLENLLRRLDANRVWGELTLLEASGPAPAADEPAKSPERHRSLAQQWDDEVARLPPGWRDVLVELELDSSDFLAQAALVGAPLNPARPGGRVALRFAVTARGQGGYGTSPGMARRCLERMDREGITGELHVVDSRSDVNYVATQGPVLRSSV